MFALTDAAIWVAGVDFSGDSNKLMASAKVEAKDTTTFGSGGWRSRIGGLRSAEMAVDGYWSSAVDAAGIPDLGVVDKVVTLSPDGSAGSVVYMFQAGQFSYDTGEAVGEVLPFSIDAQGTNGVGMVRGLVAIPKGDVSATGPVGSALDLGAVGSGQHLYAAVHLFAAGTTVTVTVESDVDDTFAAPTTRATIGPLTATGGTWMTRLPGPITDTWWRITVTDITGTHTVAAAIAIQ